MRALVPQSFSFGEAAIVCQLMALLATDCLAVTATVVVCGYDAHADRLSVYPCLEARRLRSFPL